MPAKLNRARSVDIAARIESLLADGVPRLPADISRELDVDYYRAAEGLRLLRQAVPPRVLIVGVWAQLAAVRGVGLGPTRKDAGVYSCPGAPLLPPDTVVTRGRSRRRVPQGSGVVAPAAYRRGFRWGAGVYF